MYWYCIELIAGRVDRENISFELEEDAETIALEWGLDQLKVQEIMSYMVNLGLFEESGGVVTCFKLAQRLDDTNSKNPEIKKIQKSLNNQGLGVTPNDSEQIRLDKTRLDNNSLSTHARERFPMNWDWDFSEEEIRTRLRMMGQKPEKLTQQVLGKFINHYSPNDGDWRTQAQWEAKLCSFIAGEKDERNTGNGKQGDLGEYAEFVR